MLLEQIFSIEIDSYVEPGLPDQVRIQFNGGEPRCIPASIVLILSRFRGLTTQIKREIRTCRHYLHSH